MEKDQITIGRYRVEKVVGKGGMGEILLAYDPECARYVALKRIREDMKGHAVMRKRFLKEARITASLTHPGIISIFSLHEEELYYTMPYVEGQTLKEMLKAAHQEMRGSIGHLLPMFKVVCQTVAYAHSKGIIHRDVKPENILVGSFGEVILFDWGLAQVVGESEVEVEIESSDPGLTRPGKLVGTVAYMPPERAMGQPANEQTDIYALGVILYQIITLHLPFHRGSVKEFRKKHQLEKLQEPAEVAPYREVPPQLCTIVKKCLEADPKQRYASMDELMGDLNDYMEGRSHWFSCAKLNIEKKRHWEFQENILVSKYLALGVAKQSADWVSVMVSKGSFAESMKLVAQVRIEEGGAGIGFLLCVPDASERESPMEGYCLWLAAEGEGSTQLFRSTVEVMRQAETTLKKGAWHTIEIERVENNITLKVDGKLCFSYLSYLPLFGTHVGLLSRDANYAIEPMEVFEGSHNLQVSCLSVPDAFLASKDYKRAYANYKRIAHAFRGHAEAREARFRCGIVLLEQAKAARSAKKVESYFAASLDEFAKLHEGSGAPLEYLGKALVYQTLRDHSEEIKCLELGLRRYAKHPLVDALSQQVVYRMHEAASSDRRSAYQLILIVLRLLPGVVKSEDSVRLFNHLISQFEPLSFIESGLSDFTTEGDAQNELIFALHLAYCLAAPYILQEIAGKVEEGSAREDVAYALFDLGSYEMAHRVLERSTPLYTCHTQSLAKAIEELQAEEEPKMRDLHYLMRFALRSDQEELVHELAERFTNFPMAADERITLDAMRIWAYLKQENTQAAGEIFDNYALEMLNQESTLLHPLYGCYLCATEGEEMARIHLAGVTEIPHPRSWALLGHEITSKVTESPAWYSTSFLFERRRLYAQLTLFYQCAENPELEGFYRELEREEYINASS